MFLFFQKKKNFKLIVFLSYKLKKKQLQFILTNNN